MMNVLMDKVEEVVIGSSRGLLIVDNNKFLKSQVEAYIVARDKNYSWFNGDIFAEPFKELLTGKQILVFDGLNFNKRAIMGLLYNSMANPDSEFEGQFILFGTTTIKNPKLRSCFSIWANINGKE